MSVPAFYLAESDWQKILILKGEEAHHANVLRLRSGDEVMILDGKGKIGLCRIIQKKPNSVELELICKQKIEPPVSRAVIALALSKAVRRGFFLEKAAELGAWEVWLWQAARSQGRLDDKLITACKNQLKAGAKQCHNPWFPTVKVCKDAYSVAQDAKSIQWRLFPWEIKASDKVISENELARPGSTIYVIGPEGGITEEEAEIFKSAEFKYVSLGERILRCETAAVLCLGLHWWASQRYMDRAGETLK